MAGCNSLLHFQLGGERCCVILPVTPPPGVGAEESVKTGRGGGGGGGNGEKTAHYLEGFKREEGEHGTDMERWGENSRR